MENEVQFGSCSRRRENGQLMPGVSNCRFGWYVWYGKCTYQLSIKLPTLLFYYIYNYIQDQSKAQSSSATGPRIYLP